MSNMANMSTMSNMATMARVEATMATIQSELRGKEAKEEQGAKKLRKKIKDKEEEIEELEKKLSSKETTKDKSRGRRGGKQEKKEGTKKVAVVAFETLEKQLEVRRNELEDFVSILCPSSCRGRERMLMSVRRLEDSWESSEAASGREIIP